MKHGSIIMALLILAACGTTNSNGANAAQSGAPSANQPVQTRVYLKKSCPISGDKGEGLFAAVGAALLPGLIDTTVDRLGTALREWGKAKPSMFPAVTTAHFYQASPAEQFTIKSHADMSCLVVIRAPFSPDAKSDALQSEAFFSSHKDTLALDYNVAGVPDFYFEGVLKFSPDATAFQVVPKNFFYGRGLENGRENQERAMVLNLSFSSPAKDGTGTLWGSQSISFGKLKAPHDASGADLKALATPWIPLPVVPDATSKTITTAIATQKLIKTNTRAACALATTRHVRSQCLTIEELPNATDKTLIIIRAKAKNTQKERAKTVKTLTHDNNKALVIAKRALAALTDPDQSDIAKARRAVAAAEADLEAAAMLAKAVQNHSDASDDVTALKTLSEAKGSLVHKTGVLTLQSERVAEAAPFTLTATLVETKEANKVILFFADVFDAGSTELKAALKDQWDPASRSAAKKQRLADEAAQRKTFHDTTLNALKATQSVDKQRLLTEALTGNEDPTQLLDNQIALKNAEIEARYACKSAQVIGAAPLECGPYL